MTKTLLFKQDFTLYPPAHQSHITFAIHVPEGMTAFGVSFSFSPILETDKGAMRRALDKEGLTQDRVEDLDGFRNLLTLSINDSRGFRGAHHSFNDHQEILIKSDAASEGFLAGPVTSGTWEVILSNHGIFSDQVRGSLEVWGEHAQALQQRPAPLAQARMSRKVGKNRDRDWMQPLKDTTIELHAHTVHSDAVQTTQELLTSAAELGLEWLAITDHNTISALVEPQAYQTYPIGVNIIPGIEYTTFFGHFLVHGPLEVIQLNWTEVNLGNVEAYFRALKDRGVLITIAHPYDVGNPYCTGCRFDFPLRNYDFIDTIEVWNETDPHSKAKNRHAYTLWQELLKAGMEMNASFGRDWHGPRPYSILPMTHILIPAQASRADILASLDLGRTYVTCGPTLDWHINHVYQIGDRIPASELIWHHQLRIDGIQTGDSVKLWNDQEVLMTLPIQADGTFDIEVDLAIAKGRLMRLEVWNTADEVILFTNPIYGTPTE